MRRTNARQLVGGGLVIVAAGIAGSALVLDSRMPIAVAAIAWAVGGFGIGLAYSTLSLVVLREAPPGQEGTATSALQLLDNLGVAVGAGIGGAAVAIAVSHGHEALGIRIAYAVSAAVALLGVVVARRLPGYPLS